MSVKLPAEGCMACKMLGCSSVALFEYVGEKNAWKTLCVERHAFFSPQLFNMKTLNTSFNKSGTNKADNKS